MSTSPHTHIYAYGFMYGTCMVNVQNKLNVLARVTVALHLNWRKMFEMVIIVEQAAEVFQPISINKIFTDP